MGIFGKLFKGPEIDQVKSADSKQKMRRLFDSVVPDGGSTSWWPPIRRCEAVQLRLGPRRKTTYGSLIVGWKRGRTHSGGRAHSSGPLRLRRSGNLPPVPQSKRPIRISTPRTPSSSTRMGVTIWPSTPSSGWRMRSCSSTWTRDRKSRPLRLSSRPVTPRSEERVPCRFPWSRSVPSCWPW